MVDDDFHARAKKTTTTKKKTTASASVSLLSSVSLEKEKIKVLYRPSSSSRRRDAPNKVLFHRPTGKGN